MVKKQSLTENMFNTLNYLVLIFLALLCIIPFIHVIAVSLSDSASSSGGKVFLWPMGFNFQAYRYALTKPHFINSIRNSFYRLGLGVTVNTILTILAAYPLSKRKEVFPGRTLIAWFFVVTMLISGGIIPIYLIVNMTMIRNSIWALILPYATPAFNITILLNFFRGIPIEIEESAVIDGAGPWRTLIRMYLPLSVPCLATLVIFQSVFHWNEWFWGMLFLDNVKHYPLATYLRNIIVNIDFDNMTMEEIKESLDVSNRSFSAAQIVIGALPIMVVYPFLQGYFIKGMTLGSIKG